MREIVATLSIGSSVLPGSAPQIFFVPSISILSLTPSLYESIPPSYPINISYFFHESALFADTINSTSASLFRISPTFKVISTGLNIFDPLYSILEYVLIVSTFLVLILNL